jgi:hypothetical protein
MPLKAAAARRALAAKRLKARKMRGRKIPALEDDLFFMKKA